jgi:hypothetical protein
LYRCEHFPCARVTGLRIAPPRYLLSVVLLTVLCAQALSDKQQGRVGFPPPITNDPFAHAESHLRVKTEKDKQRRGTTGQPPTADLFTDGPGQPASNDYGHAGASLPRSARLFDDDGISGTAANTVEISSRSSLLVRKLKGQRDLQQPGAVAGLRSDGIVIGV